MVPNLERKETAKSISRASRSIEAAGLAIENIRGARACGFNGVT
jgi:hypothetical protein